MATQPAQAWLLERLDGLELSDFEERIIMISTRTLRPPRQFENVWRTASEDLTFAPEDIAGIQYIVIFCSPYEQEELSLLSSIVDQIDGFGHDAPCTVWAPHSVKPNTGESRQDFSRNPFIGNLFEVGLDGIIAGEPAGLQLVLAVRSQVCRSAHNAQRFNELTSGASERIHYAASLTECIHSMLWEYLRVRLASSIPPLDHRLPAGKPRSLPGYRLGSLLGHGTYGRVYKLHHQDENQVCNQVVKAVDKSVVEGANDLKDMRRMIDVMVLLSSPTWQHPNIVQLYQIYHTPTHILLRMENGGPENLYRRLSYREKIGDQQRPLQCRKVSSLMSQAVEAMRHLHIGPHVCHRDIKPENYIVTEPDGERILLKVADFGLAIVQEGRGRCRNPCGTIPFSAPEVHLAREYGGFAADVWSLGTVVLELVCGVRTLETALSLNPQTSHVEIARQIRTAFAEKSFISNHLQRNALIELDDIIQPVCTMLNGLLDVNPATRWNISQAKEVLVDANIYVDTSEIFREQTH